MNIVLVMDLYTDETNASKKVGASIWVAGHAEHLRVQGHQVTVISSGEPEAGKVCVRSKTYSIFNLLIGRRLKLDECDDAKVRETLESADIVHLTLPFGLGRRIREIAQEMSIPCLASFTIAAQPFPASIFFRRMRRHFYRHVDHIHCLSSNIAEQLKKHKYTSNLHVISMSDESGIRHKMIDLYEQIIAQKALADAHEKKADSHKIHLPQTLSFKLDENYQFVNRNVFFLIFAFMFKFLLMYPIFYPVTKLGLGFAAKGREHLRQMKNGAITVSNHVHMLDGPMLNFALFPRQPIMTSIKGNFETPGVSFLMKALSVIPIPETPKALFAFMNAMKAELGRHRLIHFYPEAALWPGHTELRPFKKGAFHLAVMTDMPIVPMVVKPRNPVGILKLYKKKPCISIVIGEPIPVPQSGSKKQRIEALRDTVHTAMQQMLKANGTKGKEAHSDNAAAAQ